MIKIFIACIVIFFTGVFLSKFLYSGEATNIRTIEQDGGYRMVIADIVQDSKIVRKDFELDANSFYNSVTKNQEVTYCYIPLYVAQIANVILISVVFFTKKNF
jgi:hypothetical protein